MDNAEIREFYMDPANWQGNARQFGETFDDYQMRRAHENRAAKEYHKGTVCWNSAKRGTYRKKNKPAVIKHKPTNNPKKILTDLERAAVR